MGTDMEMLRRIYGTVFWVAINLGAGTLLYFLEAPPAAYENAPGVAVPTIVAEPMSVATVPVGKWPIWIGVNPTTNRVYVANFDNAGTVSVIDGTNDTVVGTVLVGASPTGVGVNPTTNKAYVANDHSGDVQVIDGTSNTVVATVGVGSDPVGVGVNRGTNRIYVANAGTKTVSVIADSPASVGLDPASD